MAPVIDILVRTYFRDFRWLELSLASILKFVEGFRRIVVVMPASSLDRLHGIEIGGGERVTLLACQEYPDDYLGQQITKLTADLLTDATLIAHVDSDCIFHESCSLPDLLTVHGRPVIRALWRSRRTAADGWRRCVADFHGEPLPFDALVPPPILYPSQLYRELRAECWIRHGIELEQWVQSRTFDAMSEFSLMTAQAWFRRRDDFCWEAADDQDGWPCSQYWSRSPKAVDMRARISRSLYGTKNEDC